MLIVGCADSCVYVISQIAVDFYFNQKLGDPQVLKIIKPLMSSCGLALIDSYYYRFVLKLAML